MKMKNKALLGTMLMVAGSGVLLGGEANAGSASANMNVQTTVVANCTISTVTLNFGNYDAIVVNATTPLDSSSTVDIKCTNGAPVTVDIGQGLHADVGSLDLAPLRRMEHSVDVTNHINYQLYSESTRTTVWGKGGGTGLASTGTGATQIVPVYGRIPAGQTTAKVGLLQDTVQVTVNF